MLMNTVYNFFFSIFQRLLKIVLIYRKNVFKYPSTIIVSNHWVQFRKHQIFVLVYQISKYASDSKPLITNKRYSCILFIPHNDQKLN